MYSSLNPCVRLVCSDGMVRYRARGRRHVHVARQAARRRWLVNDNLKHLGREPAHVAVLEGHGTDIVVNSGDDTLVRAVARQKLAHALIEEDRLPIKGRLRRRGWARRRRRRKGAATALKETSRLCECGSACGGCGYSFGFGFFGGGGSVLVGFESACEIVFGCFVRVQ